jgi:hypothetical protein
VPLLAKALLISGCGAAGGFFSGLSEAVELVHRMKASIRASVRSSSATKPVSRNIRADRRTNLAA